MTPFDVLNTIRQAGGRVFVEAGEIRVVAKPGTLTPAAAVVLRENKAALVGILPNAEREAIQWTEGLDPAAAEVVVSTARREWEGVVVADDANNCSQILTERQARELGKEVETIVPVVEIEADDAMVSQMAAMGVPNPEYDLGAWAEQQLGHVSTNYPTLPEQNAYTEVDPAAVIPCVFCGSLELWTDAKGGTHCQHCDGARLQRSQQLLDDAARLRAGRTLTFKVGGKAAPTPAPWPPAHLQLPDTVEGIEQGRPATARQQNLLDGRGTQIERMTPDKQTRSRSFVPAGGW